jgi:cytochrome c biogenesis protein CcmG/thiol:disulfide interchange protein DsbE
MSGPAAPRDRPLLWRTRRADGGSLSDALASSKWVVWAKRLLRELVITGLIVLVVVGAMQWKQRRDQRGGGGALPVGQAAPAFELAAFGAPGRVSLESLRGEPVILNFWATWCGPCMRELPDIEGLHRESAGRFHVVTVVSEGAADVLPVIQKKALTVPVLADGNGAVFSAYKVERLPTTVILDRGGLVVHDFTGAADVDILRDHMERLIAAP